MDRRLSGSRLFGGPRLCGPNPFICWPGRQKQLTIAIALSLAALSGMVEEVSYGLGEVFTQLDPPAVAADLTPPDFEAFVRLLCPKAEAEGLTIVARSVETAEMIGALLTEDSASEEPPGMDHLSVKFNPILDILGQLDAAYRSGKAMSPGESLPSPSPGGRPEIRLSGCGAPTCRQMRGERRAQGYRVAVTEATNGTSQHIFRKQGFVERVRGSYRDHRFEGQAAFASIAEHGGPILMDKLLAP